MVMTAAGSALAISAAMPASLTQAGYAALTYEDIGGVDKIGTYGGTPARVNFQPLKGGVQKYKGAFDFGALQLTLAPDPVDAGQALLAAAAVEAKAQYSIRVTLPDGAARYFRARVFAFTEQVDGADTVLLAATVIEITTPIVRVAGGTELLPPAGYAFVTTGGGSTWVTTNGGTSRVIKKVS